MTEFTATFEGYRPENPRTIRISAETLDEATDRAIEQMKPGETGVLIAPVSSRK